MANEQAAKRYARAVFGWASEQDQLATVAEELQSLAALLTATPELERLFANPVIPRAKRHAIIESLLASRLSPVTYRFIGFLEQRDRLALIAAICSAFADLYRDHRGIVQVTVTSAMPLPAEQQQRIEQAMRQRLGREPETTVVVDARLLGGFKVKAYDTIYDCSLLTQLDSLKKRMISA